MRKARGWLILIAVCALGILGGRRAYLRAADTLEDAAKKIPKTAKTKTPQYLTKSAILPVLEEGQKLKARLSQARAIVVRLDNETIQTKSKLPSVRGVFEPIHAGLMSKPNKTDEYGGGMLSRLDYIEKNLSQSLAVLGKAATSNSVTDGRKQLVDAVAKVKQAKSQANWTIDESKKLISAAIKRESKNAATASNLDKFHGQLKSGLDEVAALLDESLKSKPLSQKNLMSIGTASAASPKAVDWNCSNWNELNPLIDKCSNDRLNAQIRCDALEDGSQCLANAEKAYAACMAGAKAKCKPPKCKCPAPCGKEIDSPCSAERCAQACPAKCKCSCGKEVDAPCTDERCGTVCPAKCKCSCGKEIDSPCTEARCKLECQVVISTTNPKFDKANCRLWVVMCTDMSKVKYQKVDGEAFVKGAGDSSAISASDVVQGATGDCYLGASLATIARQNPKLIEEMIRKNPDGTYTVKYYRKRNFWELYKPKYTPEEMVVTSEFPIGTDGKPVFAQYGDSSSNGKPELWAMIAEKAYAQYRGSYNAANRGPLFSPSTEWITGKEDKVYGTGSTSLAQLADWDKKGYAVTVGTWPYFAGDNVKSRHNYYILKVDEKNNTIILGNPWGKNDVKLTEEEFKKIRGGVRVNPVK